MFLREPGKHRNSRPCTNPALDVRNGSLRDFSSGAKLRRMRLLRAAAVIACTCALAGCYVLQAASGQAEVMRKSQPIPQVIADPVTPPRTRERLELVQEAREFAIDELALPDGQSYRHYADLGRPYVVHNVVATPEFSVVRGAGASRSRAASPIAAISTRSAREASRLRLAIRGDDVSVGGVPTYSTLGPPARPGVQLDARVARHATGRHDLPRAGARAPLPARRQRLNEAFASVVEDEGVRRWLRQQRRAGETRRATTAAAARQRSSRHCCARRAARLGSSTRRAAAGADAHREAARVRPPQVPLRAAAREWGGYAGYDAWFARALNNAHLVAVATYEDCVPGCDACLPRRGRCRRSTPSRATRRHSRAMRACAPQRRAAAGRGRV